MNLNRNLATPTAWKPPANAPHGETVIVAINVYHRYMDIWESKVTTGTKDGKGAWIIEDYLYRDIDIVAWQPLPDFPEPEPP